MKCAALKPAPEGASGRRSIVKLEFELRPHYREP